MFDVWRRNIARNWDLARHDAGPALVTIVTGTESDREYWQKHFLQTRRDIFGQSGNTDIVSVCEGIRKGNFLGTLNAWIETRRALEASQKSLPEMILISMVFGKGKRFSPFSQSLGNRKPAFLTPVRAPSINGYMTTADMSNLCANSWIQHLRENGFRGAFLNWADMANVHGKIWQAGEHDYRQMDAVRLIWETEVTENLAREKEWVVVNAQTGLMEFQYARQQPDALRSRIAGLKAGAYRIGVNLGSVAVSYELLNAALEVFQADVFDPYKWVDWDPYAWIALSCKDEAQWRAEAAYEERIGKTGIRDLETLYPDFYPKIARLRQALEARTGRPLAVGVLDFGQTLFVDLGLHLSLRKSLDAMTTDTDEGKAIRELFGISHERDSDGNIIVRSQAPQGADLRDSVIVDTVLVDPGSVVHGGIVVAGRIKKLMMPYGGSALFCASDRLVFSGPYGIAFRSVAPEIDLPEGGRHTTLFLPQGTEGMVSNESIRDYDDAHYAQPILGNRLSFEEAGEIMSRVDSHELDAHWASLWQNWLQR
jgi:hypothetical protein